MEARKKPKKKGLDVDKILGAYQYVFNSPEGRLVLNDLAKFTGMAPDPLFNTGRESHRAGPDLTHAECAYRNGQQDLYKYIEAIATEE